MSAEIESWAGDWSVGLRAWVERDGHVILGKGRHELLEAIDRWHSISAAARQIGMSYRRAWLLVQSVNEAAGEPLVEAATGGHHGGGARLTPRGRLATAVFRELQEQLHQTAAGLLPQLVVAPEAETLHIAAAISLQESLGQLLADYALRQPAVRVRAVYGASDELAYHLLAGAPGDLFLSADPSPLDRLEAASLLKPGSRVCLAENALAALAPAGKPVVVRRPADLTGPGVERLALAATTCPLGACAAPGSMPLDSGTSWRDPSPWITRVPSWRRCGPARLTSVSSTPAMPPAPTAVGCCSGSAIPRPSCATRRRSWPIPAWPSRPRRCSISSARVRRLTASGAADCSPSARAHRVAKSGRKQ